MDFDKLAQRRVFPQYSGTHTFRSKHKALWRYPYQAPLHFRAFGQLGAFCLATLLFTTQAYALKARSVAQQLSQRQIMLLLNTLADAPDQGIDGQKFHTDDIKTKLASPNPAIRNRARRQLDREMIAYADAQHGLRIRPSKFDKLWAIRPAHYDAVKEFHRALKTGQLQQWLASLPPPFDGYQRLQKAYVLYSKVAGRNGWKKLRGGRPLKEGDRGARVLALRKRLAIEYPDIPGSGDDFDSFLTSAVQRFQKLHGLPVTGVVSTESIRALNVPAQERAKQIALNMERWRWLPRKEPAFRIEVNIPAAMLNAFADGRSVLQMLALAGKPVRDDMTPMLISKITSITFNPPWIVPKDIARRELFPKERHDHHYFAREGFRMRKGHLVQEPGQKSALGRIKFEFANAFSVYLHDTPDKAAFFLKRRSVSHGCVRLQQPVELAKLLLTGSSRWTLEKIDQVLSNTETVKADLRTPMTVMLLYWTAYPDSDGIAFRKDVYHWDSKLTALLKAASASAR